VVCCSSYMDGFASYSPSMCSFSPIYSINLSLIIDQSIVRRERLKNGLSSLLSDVWDKAFSLAGRLDSNLLSLLLFAGSLSPNNDDDNRRQRSQSTRKFAFRRAFGSFSESREMTSLFILNSIGFRRHEK